MAAINKELMQLVLKSSAEDSKITLEDLKKFIEEHELKPIKTIEYWDDEKTKIKYEKWTLNGKTHREDRQPAFIEYYENDKIQKEIYFENGTKTKEINYF